MGNRLLQIVITKVWPEVRGKKKKKSCKKAIWKGLGQLQEGGSGDKRNMALL